MTKKQPQPGTYAYAEKRLTAALKSHKSLKFLPQLPLEKLPVFQLKEKSGEKFLPLATPPAVLFEMARLVDGAPDLNVERGALSGLIHGCLFQQKEQRAPHREVIYTEAEAAKALGMSIEHFRKLVAAGTIQSLKKKRPLRFARVMLDQYVASLLGTPSWPRAYNAGLSSSDADRLQECLDHATETLRSLQVQHRVSGSFGSFPPPPRRVFQVIRDTLAYIDGKLGK